MKYKTVFSRYDDPRIEALGAAWLVTNSDKGTFGCKRKFAWTNVECIEQEGKNEALSYGSAWHYWMEEIIGFIKKEDRVPDKAEHWKLFQEKIHSVLDKALEEIPDENKRQEAKEDFYERIFRSVEGWRLNWEKQIHPHYKVLEVEMVVVAPIMDEEGNRFKPQMPILANDRLEPTIMRPPLVGEITHKRFEKAVWHEKTVEWDWYKVGKIDVLLEHRQSGNLVILDHKTSQYPSTYENKFMFDMQMPSYGALLKWEIEHGDYYNQYKGRHIEGMIWDICHSKIPPIPQPLKDGTLSTKRTCASWVFKMALKKFQLDMTPDYEAFIKKAETTYDPKYFVIVKSFLTQNTIDRCAFEDYALAEEMQRFLIKLYRANPAHSKQFDMLAPRYPLCDKYGKCGISNICIANYTPCAILHVRQPKLYWEAT